MKHSSWLMGSADGCSPPCASFLPADSSCKMHHCIVQCKGWGFFCLPLKTKTSLNSVIFPSPALWRSIIGRRAAPQAPAGPRQPPGLSALVNWRCCIITYSCRGWSELKCFKKSDVGLLIVLSKQYFASPF